MAGDQSVKPEDIERGKGEERLLAFKKRLQAKHTVNFFTSPVDLQLRIVNSLSRFREAGFAGFKENRSDFSGDRDC